MCCDREWHTPVGLVVHGRVGGGRVGAGGVPAAEAAAGALAAAAAAKRPLLGLCAKVFAEHEIHGGGCFSLSRSHFESQKHTLTHACTHGRREAPRRTAWPGVRTRTAAGPGCAPAAKIIYIGFGFGRTGAAAA
jgi:hypothetical protein